MDKFIQDYFFNQPYQVAWVVDPKSSLNGIFAWQEGKICPLKHCWIGKDQIKLTIGTVGGEETYRKEKDDGNQSSLTLISNNKEAHSEKESDTAFYKHAFFYFLCFNLAFLLANFIYIRMASNAASTAAQAEAKEIIKYWATDQTFNYQLGTVNSFINQNIESLNKLPATYTVEVNQFKNYLIYINSLITNISNDSITRQKSAIKILNKLAYGHLSINEKIENQSDNLKQMLTDSILIQLEPYLTSLSAQPINETRIKEAKNMLDNILSICGEQQKNQIKEKYPWIFQE